ncbi:MAG: hypothetical protein P1V20_11970 [Verrucomicrobiales bacterium]|nr:hypothetical protein [Verrucomicrobiales bacterium]
MYLFLRYDSTWLLLFFLTGCILPLEEAPFLVKDGKAGAEIIIARDCPRMVSLAAKELQRGVELITGARLPILHQPGAENQIRSCTMEPTILCRDRIIWFYRGTTLILCRQNPGESKKRFETGRR